MDPHHRKIDLQSPADLTYLLENIKHAARQKIDIAIPASAAPKGQEDAYRTRVEELVQDYVTRTLLLALPNLSINGFDAPASLITPEGIASNTASIGAGGDEEDAVAKDVSDEDIAKGNYTAYDPRLAERLRALYVQYEKEAEDVSKMRREVPVKAAEAYAKALGEVVEREVEMGDSKGDVKIEEEQGNEGKEQQQDGEKLALAGLGARQEEVEKVMKKGVGELEGLEGITEVIARLEQAGRAVEVVER